MYGRYGYLKLAKLQRIAGGTINHKKGERIWREESLQPPERHKRKRRLYHKDSAIIRMRLHEPNQVWATDFVHDELSNNQPYKMLAVVDEYTRQVLTVHVAHKMSAADVLEALHPLLTNHGKPQYIPSDNGPKFVADRFQNWLTRVGIKPIRIYPGSPLENGYNERFNVTIRRELLDTEWFVTTRQAQTAINLWLTGYDRIRPPSQKLDQNVPYEVVIDVSTDHVTGHEVSDLSPFNW
jgi:putative transposase